MKKLNFIKKTIKPSLLSIHPLLSELGHAHEPTPYFSAMLKENGLYERIIVTPKNEILSNSADALAAINNNEDNIEVCEIDMSEMQIRFLILQKHSYHRKNLFASYNTAKFLRQYLASDPEGIRLANSIKGDINVKIGHLMHTSDSSIKRLLRVGDLDSGKFGLIEEGHTSFKEVLDGFKLERMKKSAGLKEMPREESQEATKRDILDIPLTENDTLIVAVTNLKTPPNTIPLGKSEPGICRIKGYPSFSFDITDNNIDFMVDGKKIKKVKMDRFVVRDSKENGYAETFIISDDKHNGFCLTMTFQNLKNAA